MLYKLTINKINRKCLTNGEKNSEKWKTKVFVLSYLSRESKIMNSESIVLNHPYKKSLYIEIRALVLSNTH